MKHFSADCRTCDLNTRLPKSEEEFHGVGVAARELLLDTVSKLFSSPRPMLTVGSRVSRCGGGAACELARSWSWRRCPGRTPARVDPFVMNLSEVKGHRFGSLPPHVCVEFPSHSEARVAPVLAPYLHWLNIYAAEPKAHDDLAAAAAAQCDCQRFLLLCSGDSWLSRVNHSFPWHKVSYSPAIASCLQAQKV